MATAGEEHRGDNVGGSEAAVSASPSHDQKPVKVEAETDSLWDHATAEYVEKYRRYQADYLRRIKAKYFSKLAFDGTQIFSEVAIENEVIKASRFPGTRSFIDPVLNLEDASNSSSAAIETSTAPSSSRKNLRRSN